MTQTTSETIGDLQVAYLTAPQSERQAVVRKYSKATGMSVPAARKELTAMVATVMLRSIRAMDGFNS